MKEALNINTANVQLKRYLERLEKNGYIEIVSCNVREEEGEKHKPNVYRIIKSISMETLESEVYYLSCNKVNRLEMKEAIKDILTLREYRKLIKGKSNLDKILSCISA